MIEQPKATDRPTTDISLDQMTEATLIGVTRVLASVGRAFLCLDSGLNIVHPSYLLDGLLGEGTPLKVRGRPMREILGDDLSGPKGPLRRARPQPTVSMRKKYSPRSGFFSASASHAEWDARRSRHRGL